MMRSMTGYGRAETVYDHWNYVVEVRSVNSKFCDVKVHGPREFLRFEHEMIGVIRKRFARGHFDLFLRVDPPADGELAVHLDEVAAKKLFQELSRLRDVLKISEPVNVQNLLGFREIFKESEPKVEQSWPIIQKVLAQALEQLAAHGAQEGGELLNDISRRFANLRTLRYAIDAKRVEVNRAIFERYRERIQKLLGGVEIDKGRIDQEIALMTDRLDITEEMVRLQTHLEKIEKLLLRAEPKGRELEFMLQEIQREFNTTGQKSQDVGISEWVIQAKSEIEKIREQIQNVE